MTCLTCNSRIRKHIVEEPYDIDEERTIYYWCGHCGTLLKQVGTRDIGQVRVPGAMRHKRRVKNSNGSRINQPH